jgi:hypothetical protein
VKGLVASSLWAKMIHAILVRYREGMLGDASASSMTFMKKSIRENQDLGDYLIILLLEEETLSEEIRDVLCWECVEERYRDYDVQFIRKTWRRCPKHPSYFLWEVTRKREKP